MGQAAKTSVLQQLTVKDNMFLSVIEMKTQTGQCPQNKIIIHSNLKCSSYRRKDQSSQIFSHYLNSLNVV
jgi:hypothetical protein